MEFPSSFTDEEGLVFDEDEIEVGGKVVLEPVNGSTSRPILRRREFAEPGAGGGDDEFSTGGDEVGKAGEEFFGLGKAAKEVGGVDPVELAEVGSELHGVPLLETDAGGVDAVGEAGDEWGAEVGFIKAGVGDRAFGDGSCGVDEGMGEIDADGFA